MRVIALLDPAVLAVVIQANDLVSSVQELLDKITVNETGLTGHKYFHVFIAFRPSGGR